VGCHIDTTGCQCNLICPDAGPPDSGGPPPCTWSRDGANTCAAGFYCNATNCQTGTCVRRAQVESTALAPQCGCDGNTYWNETVAHFVGVPIKASGQCGTTDQAVCGGVSTAKCPNGGSCNEVVKNKTSCLPSTEGTCWNLPTACPIGAAVRSRPCLSTTCTDVCTAIHNGAQWYDDSSCP
jgi:hypothetical protein